MNEYWGVTASGGFGYDDFFLWATNLLTIKISGIRQAIYIYSGLYDFSRNMFEAALAINNAGIKS